MLLSRKNKEPPSKELDSTATAPDQFPHFLS